MTDPKFPKEQWSEDPCEHCGVDLPAIMHCPRHQAMDCMKRRITGFYAESAKAGALRSVEDVPKDFRERMIVAMMKHEIMDRMPIPRYICESAFDEALEDAMIALSRPSPPAVKAPDRKALAKWFLDRRLWVNCARESLADAERLADMFIAAFPSLGVSVTDAGT